MGTGLRGWGSGPMYFGAPSLSENKKKKKRGQKEKEGGTHSGMTRTEKGEDGSFWHQRAS